MIESGDWPKLHSRMRQMANDDMDKDVVIISLKLVLRRGSLRQWIVSKITVVEPRTSGVEILDLLTE